MAYTAPATSDQTATKNRNRGYISLRKRLKKQAEREYPGKKTFWAGGILYFGKPGDWYPQEVPNVLNVHKPAAKAASVTFLAPGMGV